MTNLFIKLLSDNFFLIFESQKKNWNSGLDSRRIRWIGKSRSGEIFVIRIHSPDSDEKERRRRKD